MKCYKLVPGVYEFMHDGKMKYRIYKNRWNGWTIAVFSEKYNQFLDSRYYPTLKAAKQAIQ